MLSTIFFYENHYGGWIELVAPLVEYYQGELVVVYGDPRMESYNMLRLMPLCQLVFSNTVSDCSAFCVLPLRFGATFY